MHTQNRTQWFIYIYTYICIYTDTCIPMHPHTYIHKMHFFWSFRESAGELEGIYINTYISFGFRGIGRRLLESSLSSPKRSSSKKGNEKHIKGEARRSRDSTPAASRPQTPPPPRPSALRGGFRSTCFYTQFISASSGASLLFFPVGHPAASFLSRKQQEVTIRATFCDSLIIRRWQPIYIFPTHTHTHTHYSCRIVVKEDLDP